MPSNTVKTDESNGVVYVGFANSTQAVDADPVWQILRITSVSSGVTVEYADGNFLPDNKWSDRTSLEYK